MGESSKRREKTNPKRSRKKDTTKSKNKKAKLSTDRKRDKVERDGEFSGDDRQSDPITTGDAGETEFSDEELIPLEREMSSITLDLGSVELKEPEPLVEEESTSEEPLEDRVAKFEAPVKDYDMSEVFSLCQRFFSKTKLVINRPEIGPCWEWQGAVSDSGYGSFWVENRTEMTHKFSYMMFKGRITPGMQVCHKCDNPLCCNPHHLFLGDRGVNMRDAIAKGRLRGTFGGERALTEDDVREMRRLYVEEGLRYQELAKRFGCHVSTAKDVIKRRTWRHV